MEAEPTAKSLPFASNFAEDKAEMTLKHQVILLEFMAEFCPYCLALEENFLKPMLRSGEYEHKVLFRQIQHDDPYGSIIDFNGDRIFNEELSKRYNIGLTPTMVFLGTDGQQLVERMVGLGPEDYFSYYIDKAIEEALKKMWHS